MERKNFLKGIGLAGLGLTLPIQKTFALRGANGVAACALVPSETAGPFPLDLTENNFYFRQDVRETRTGAPLKLKMKIIGANNCLPMQNVRVNIWHCDKDGLYSGYQTETGLTYLRGYQITDANGEVEFTTIFPGWYPGRVCHIHFQVYVSSVYAAVSQLTFPVTEKNAVYSANTSLYTKGADPLAISSDGIFSDGYSLQLATLTSDGSGGYNSYLEVAISGSGTTPTGLAALEPETGGQFQLLQNFPNPYNKETTIPFVLTNPSDVLIDIWDLSGKKMASISRGKMNAGRHEVKLNMSSLGLSTATYVYQLQVSNENGVYRQCKVMTAGN